MAQLLTPNALKELSRQRYADNRKDPNDEKKPHPDKVDDHLTNKMHDYIYEPKPIMSARELEGEWYDLLHDVEDPNKTIRFGNVLVLPEHKKLWNSFIKSTSKRYDINEALIELSQRYKDIENPTEPGRGLQMEQKGMYKRGGMIHFGNMNSTLKHRFN